MTTALQTLFYSFGAVIFFLGLQGIAFVPLTLVYESWKRRFLKNVPAFTSTVSIIIPAYNEETTIRDSVSSVLASVYPDFEVIVVNDGSTDATEEAIRDYIDSGRIRYISKKNGGKASALNAGIAISRGEAVIFTDADSFFLPDTVAKMVRWFGDPSIDAVCGNDAPINPATPLQKFLAVTTHIGTGFVRRALSVTKCLPIITGNLGAVRTRVLKEIGGFKEIWGEDLEITFRLYKNRNRIVFDPEPKVLAECPSTVTALWKQRIRWIRSYIKIAFLHKDIFFNKRFAPFSYYLPINFMNMTVVPLLQLAMLVLIPWAYFSEHLYFTDAVEVISFLGIGFFLFIALFSIILDRDYRDLKYLPYGLLILPLSYFYNLVVVYSWWKELRRDEEKWLKIERTRALRAGLSWVWAVVLVVLSIGGTYAYFTYIKIDAPLYKPAFELGLSTHFDAWGDWRKAISNILQRKDVSGASVIGVSAGRVEWTYFKWKGQPDAWSNHQRSAKEDMLFKAADTFHKSKYRVAAFIDVFAPKYIEDHPGTAAIGFDRKVHTDQVAFTEVVDGEFGDNLIDMIEYVAANYPVEIIDLTELPYYSYSYNDKDLISYKKRTGKADWPRLQNGFVDRDDPTIWEWRGSAMEGFIARAANAVHKHKKLLYVDVPVSWDDIKRSGREAGLDYRTVLKHADAIVIWNYYYLEGLNPEFSEKLSRYVATEFPADRVYISIGLWGRNGNMPPEQLDAGVKSVLAGGVRNIWITPDSLMTDEHWSVILPYLKGNKN